MTWTNASDPPTGDRPDLVAKVAFVSQDRPLNGVGIAALLAELADYLSPATAATIQGGLAGGGFELLVTDGRFQAQALNGSTAALQGRLALIVNDPAHVL